MTPFIVGLDVGQAADFTAIAVLEHDTRPTGAKDPEQGEFWEDTYVVRHLERPALKTPYPDVVRRVRASLDHPKLAGNAELVVDATGVGRPVVDMLREAGCEPRPVTITGGQHVTAEDGMWRVPKRILVSCMAIALQTGRLTIVRKLPLADVLSREMLNFKVRINAHANESYEAWREGDHDDLVLAVALAVWWGERSAEAGWRLKPGGDLKEARRRAFAERQELPWWQRRTPIDRTTATRWRR